MPSSHECYHSIPNSTTTSRTYPDTPAHNYYARLAEKAAPSGTVHINSYDAETSYSQPVYYARAPATRLVKEVLTSREAPSPPTRVVRERVFVQEPVREPLRVVQEVVNKEVDGTGRAKVIEQRVDQRDEFRERGFVKNVAGKGVGAVWKALGGK